MARSKDPREKTRYTGATLATQVVTTLAALLFLAPLLIILNYSFKTKRELYIGNPLALPESLNLTNYQNAYAKLDLSVTFVNTALYTIVAVAFLALLCGAAAWTIARNKGRFYRFAYLYFIIGILIPAQALFLPIYIVGYRTGLVNTRVGVILMFIATNLSFGVFLMTSFMVHRAGGAGGGGAHRWLLGLPDIFYHRYAPAQARHGYAHHHAVLPDLERLPA